MLLKLIENHIEPGYIVIALRRILKVVGSIVTLSRANYT